MSRESISKIKEAESAAEKMIADARLTAVQLRERTEREGRELCARTEAEVSSAMQTTLEEIRTRAAALSEKLEGENGEEMEKFRHDVSLRRKIAEKIIIRGLEAKCR